ncbi:hypothetical protein [Butyricimonas paravirosa]|uniref:hypothetical protein n=1 Tax=Butyricimonas paravirosa TaxID=1472417 RepID=UPI0022E4833C|nr:hypothetical protein [Butyricimonas paravirosa]
MPCISENIICVTVPELEKCSLALSTIKIGLSRQRQGLVSCWEHHKIGNTVYIHFNSLKDKYKEIIQRELCGGLPVEEWVRFNTIRELLPPVSQNEKEELSNFTITRERVDVTSGEISTEERTKLNDDYVCMLLYQARWFRLMHKDVYKYNHNTLKRLKVTGIKEFRDICITLANNPTPEFPDGAKLPKNYNACHRRQQEYEKEGILALVSGKFGNTGARKVDDERLQVLIDLYSDPHKPDYVRVTKLYNEIVLQNEWTIKDKPAVISESCVKYNLNIPEVMQVWYLARHGVQAWKNLFGYTILRYRPSTRDAVWCGDGTKVNLFYITPSGKAAKLNVYAIVDAHSGYWLGWDISEESDNMGSVQRAFRMAVIRSGYRLPFQMQYDGDKSNNYFKRLTTLHFPAMPNNGQSKIIERCFKNLQDQHMRYADGFTGMNIKSKNINNHLNEDFIESLYKDNSLKNKQETIELQEWFLHVVNNTPGKDGKTPKEKYFGSQNPDTREIVALDWINMFWEWNENECVYAKEGISWVENKIKRVYEVAEGYEFDFKNDQLPERYTPDCDFACKYIRQKFYIRFDPLNRSRVALYKEEADNTRRFVAWALEKDRMAYAVQDYKEDEKAEINKRLTIKKEQQKRAKQKREAAASLMNSEEIMKLGYKFYDKATLSAAEADLYGEKTEPIEEKTSTPKKSRKEYLKERRDKLNNKL